MTWMRIRRHAAALLASGMAAACALAPPYERPAAPLASSYPGQTAGTAASDLPASEIAWRDFFTDPRLQSLISEALGNNRDLRMAALRIEEARAQYGIQAADHLPSVNGIASGSQARIPASISPGGRAAISRSYQVGVSLAAFELDFFGRVRSLSDAALARYLATEEAARSAHITLVAEVAKAHFSERAFAEQQELAQRTLQAREAAYQMARQRFEVGASSALDLRQNEAQWHSARVAVMTLARQQAQAANALVLLVGRPLAGLPPAQPLSAHGIASDIPAGMPSDLLLRRPDILAAEQRLISANANIGAARAAFFPRITLTASGGTASAELSGLFGSGSRSWSFLPQLVLPIFDGGRNRANLDLAHLRKDIAVAEYEKSIQTAFREVADALVARAALEEQELAQQALLLSQEERLKLAQARHQGGISGFLEVLDAQRELFAAEQAMAQTRLLRLVNSVDLYRALGGGLLETAIAKDVQK